MPFPRAGNAIFAYLAQIRQRTFARYGAVTQMSWPRHRDVMSKICPARINALPLRHEKPQMSSMRHRYCLTKNKVEIH